MDKTSWDALIRRWVEWWGRQRKSEPVEFPEGQIVVQMQGFKVNDLLGAVYLNLAPNIYAVITDPDGNYHRVPGGYNQLREGNYGVQFIDKRDRADVLPPISETTLDGARVSFTVYTRYRVIDPLRVLEIDQPLQTYFNTIESDVKEYIRTHKHDDIVDVHDNIDSNHLSRFITQQQSRHPFISRAITLIDIGIKERQGDPELTGMRKTIQVQEKQNRADDALQGQRQELERKLVEQESFVREYKAKAEARIQDILKKVREQEIELDNERRRYQRKQDRNMKALETISRALTAPGYPRNPNEIKGIIEELINALKADEAAASKPEATPNSKPAEAQASSTPATDKNAEKIENLTNTLLNLLDHRNSGNSDRP